MRTITLFWRCPHYIRALDLREGSRTLMRESVGFGARQGDRPSAMDTSDLLSRISSDPAICGGRSCIKGTRIRVADVGAALAHGTCKQNLLADFDSLSAEDIAAALLYAARATEHSSRFSD